MTEEAQKPDEVREQPTAPQTPESNKVPRRRAEMEHLEEADTRESLEEPKQG